jgi:hypothetical protein
MVSSVVIWVFHPRQKTVFAVELAVKLNQGAQSPEKEGPLRGEKRGDIQYVYGVDF